MTIKALHQQVSGLATSFKEALIHPSFVKVQIVFFDALNIFISTMAASAGIIVGVVFGAIIVTAGSVIGVGSLAMHLINLYGMCIKDGAMACYSTSYSYFHQFRPQYKASTKVALEGAHV
jgi:hypothetical protein